MTHNNQTNSTWVLGDRYTFLLSTPAVAILEVESNGQQGPPLHVHTAEEESFYVLEGELEITRDGATTTATKGDLIHFPRGTPHSFRNIAAGGSRILVVLTPGHFAQLFHQIGIADATEAQDPLQLQQTQQKLMSLAGDFGLQIVGPPPQASAPSSPAGLHEAAQ